MKNNRVKILLSLVLVLTVMNMSHASSTQKEIQAIQDHAINMSLNKQTFVAKEEDGTILAPIIYNNRTYLPVRQLAEAIGVSVDWDNQTRTVILQHEQNTNNTPYASLMEENRLLEKKIESLEEDLREVNKELNALKESAEQKDSSDNDTVSKEVLYWSGGNLKYEGELLNDMYHGVGKAYRDQGQLKYDGQWKEGKYHGYGKSYLLDELEYDGQWQDGKRHGSGKYYVRGKLIYDGEWKNGKRHGTGKLLDDGQLVYEGGWQDNEWYGYGIWYVDPDQKYGFTYEGEWDGDDLHGTGKQYDKEGNIVYIGEWKYNKKHGFGTCYYNGAMSYIGGFKEGSYDGWGLFFDDQGIFDYEAISDEGRVVEVLSKNLKQVNIPAYVPIEVISGQGETEIHYEESYIQNNNNLYIDGEGNEIYKEMP
ncbi:hypothetical protein HZI73_04925 [Vallitalea pronyensis]|uniref:Copper amine oxidase-like N-terminal domain-containing protein n=1 Tax=Vallitalea pronyensis TaxID=1348613 RepID=A0A8J8MHE7_9FIRM|nr:copper amine oxidase N-terminal domain-containing protein [Vallitalea pronyensis]QUI21675.1 hypothetical protein HZI73_04925 [Vallitalea pronyensis]